MSRVCFAVEIDPLYVDVAVRRWQDFTGEEATRRSDQRSFYDVVAEQGQATASPVPPDHTAES